MTGIHYEYFYTKWLERAERKENKSVIDIVDKFISLWIAFNGWMKRKFGEDLKDRDLINEVKKSKDIKKVFYDLRENNQCFIKNLDKLKKYLVADMRDANNRIRTERYNGTFESLIKTIYQIRCNLFHGRKGTEKRDLELICLSYNILLPLFKKYLEKHNC